MFQSLALIAILAGAPALADAQNPAAAPPPASASPIDWTVARAAVATLDVLAPGGTLLRQTHGISLGDPPRILTRYSVLAGSERVVATFPGRMPVAAWKMTAADTTNDIAVLLPEAPIPEPPPPATYIRWWYAKVYVMPTPAERDTAILAFVNEPLTIGKLRVIPLSGDHAAGLPVMDVQGNWIGLTGRIEDATGTFSYVTGSEDVVPVLFGPQAEVPLTRVPASFVWCSPKGAAGLLVRAVLRAHEKPEDAGPFFQLALKRDPGMPETYYWMGMVDFRTQRFSDAESSFVQAGRQRPGWALPFHMAGAAANQQGHYQIAIDHYDHALAIDPRSAMTLNNKAGSLYNLHRTSEAMDILNQAIAADSTYAPAYQMLGAAYLATGRRDEAERIYQKLLTLDTRTANNLKVLLDQNSKKN